MSVYSQGLTHSRLELSKTEAGGQQDPQVPQLKDMGEGPRILTLRGQEEAKQPAERANRKAGASGQWRVPPPNAGIGEGSKDTKTAEEP